ncbi:hypothetical protein N8I74_06240 [Chitiniphilus purpureus]|uniref:Uncharacterized protein n=1 Tax=Chitiniphilus purpureus TaxID=2981137 RepID=A0ABY6DQF9_9NEIS|nr:polyhydroxyalkanoate granule-associated phasin [Chitiniphilus sp. CD1]UXY16614.1 hypothetical protein N8I74_06240 [Chitiniphilus sp. CD1]
MTVDNPYLAWWRNGLTWWEIWWAAPQVVTQRVTRMALAKQPLSPRDQREFTRMGTEKLDAFSRAGWAMLLECWRMQQQAWFAGLSGWTALAGGQRRPRPPHWDSSRLWAATMAPVHRTVTANARRLGPFNAYPALAAVRGKPRRRPKRPQER